MSTSSLPPTQSPPPTGLDPAQAMEDRLYPKRARQHGTESRRLILKDLDDNPVGFITAP